jgi:O-antigen ligase
MSNAMTEKTVSRIIAIGLGVTTVAVFTQSVTDPVNVTKLFLLGGFAFAAFGASTRLINKEFFNRFKLVLFLVGLFLLASLSALLASSSPLSQSFYGAYGRNNGFLLYLLLSLMLIATLTVKKEFGFKTLLASILFAGTINVFYALWVLAFGDFIGWNNPYGNLLGTLGNPNFIGSFFGMFSAVLFAFLLAPKSSTRIRICALIVIPLVFLGIIQSHAVQGKVLFVTAFAIASVFLVRNLFKAAIASVAYILFLGMGFILALLGTLQRGPFAEILYKDTVSLRGQYWYAGLKTGLANSFFGAGFDSYGDWYRRSRRESALTFPGVDTITNASHNVYLDIFAFGGWPLFICYVLIIVAVLASIVKFYLRNRVYNPVFVSLSGVWLCYQLQSTISINQIGLAIWGWVFGAAIISYEKYDRLKDIGVETGTKHVGRNAKKINQTLNQSVVSAGLVAGLGSVLGLIIASPPLSADMKWRKAQTSQNAKLFEEALQPSFMNPMNSFKINNIVGLFETSGLTELAHTYGLKATEFNRDNFESWQNLYRLSKSTDSERALALTNMKRLDPFNKFVGEDLK